MSDTLPGIILACTLRGTGLILVAALAGPLARRLFGRDGGHWLWLVALAALLWPLPPHTALSLQNLWVEREGSPRTRGNAPGSASSSTGMMPVFIRVRDLKGGMNDVARKSADETSPASDGNARHSSNAGRVGQWLVGLWLGGVIVNLAQLLRRWRRTKGLLRDARLVVDARAVALGERFGLRGRVRLAVTSRVRAPALAGIWHPRILIPEGWLEGLAASELESVLLHELGHQVRGDLIWEWLFAIARCAHWMNPAVWLAERLARHERELACDAWALDRSASAEAYGDALVEALKRVHRCPAGAFGIVAMADDVRQIARRLEWIGRYRPSPGWVRAMALAPALLALAAVGSDPLPAKTESPAAPSAPAAISSVPGIVTPVEAKPVARESLPREKRSVELVMCVLRAPEATAKQLGLPGTYSREDFHKLVGAFRTLLGTEVIALPTLISRSGSRGTFQANREFRYGMNYKASGRSGLMIPDTIETVNLGMTVTWTADLNDETSAHLNMDPEFVRLIGFVTPGGKFTRALPPPAGANWQRRLAACDMPAGAEGDPLFYFETFKKDLDLRPDQVAVFAGVPEVQPPPGVSMKDTGLDFLAVQIEVAQ